MSCSKILLGDLPEYNMSCSKILLGDLPELTYEIIKYFQNDYSNLLDYSTLHSCILVNRLWCRIAIPLLWENPFSIPNRNYNKMIEIYLYNLNDDVKTKLNEYKIINNSLSSRNIMFNYVKFLKYLNICRYMFYVEKWSDDATSTKHFEQNFMRLVHMSLFKIFIENGVNLRTLEIEIGTLDIHCYDYQNILKLILQNQNFIHNIGNLQLNIVDNIENMVTNNHVLQIIHLHQNLKKIKILINLIENIKQSLNYLSMIIWEEYPLTGSFILKNLGQILPSKLEYLSLVLNVKESDFRAFLENSQGVFVNKLSIELRRGSDDTLHYIKEYIMKEKRVKYLAIKDNENNKELFDLKEEVREFELHNIRVRRHRDLFISDLSDFIWS
ncbi:unnamed protein product [Rhizophagus irregularis]|nr:unnamed protein product [Rhizophagus irregularis]